MEITEQFIRFLVAGGIAAVVDVLGYNWFLKHWPTSGRVVASVFSTTFAMTTSFSINRSWVFVEANGGSWPVVEFVVVTLIAAYGLQSFVIWLLSLDIRESPSGDNVGGLVCVSWIGFPRREVKRLAYGLTGCGGTVSTERVDFVERNLVKGMALGVALIWNFSWYRWYVFV